ncbi:MAG: Ni/Fe hydrogenase subunit alpha [Planctomycetia bacterium]
MTEPRQIVVKGLTRVEGAGSLRARVTDGRVDIVEFAIYEPPRFFERLLAGREIREVPDIVARICGICPVSYQLTACRALESALGIAVTPEIHLLRRLLACGEWIQSHALHIHLLHAPDFLGCDSCFTYPEAYAGFLDRGLRMKAIGGRIVEVIGGRAVHPVNVAVGGFHRTPDAAAIRGLLSDLEWGLHAAADTLHEVSRFSFPNFTQPYECVSLRAARGYPMNEGRIVSSTATGDAGLDIPIDDYPRHFVERQVSHSTALSSFIVPGDRPYLCGPLSRLNNCLAELPSAARRAADTCGIGWPSRNPFHAIVARAVEIIAAFEEALAIARSCRAPVTPCRISSAARAGAGCHATEAPRGLLYHRYEIGADGLVAKATIIPPTSQNQARIESDLRAYLPSLLESGDDQASLGRRDDHASLGCERLIRSYDPCISCATHFLTLHIAR